MSGPPEQVVSHCADGIAGIQIGSGYYSTAVAYDEARECACSALSALGTLPAETRADIERAIMVAIVEQFDPEREAQVVVLAHAIAEHAVAAVLAYLSEGQQ